MDKELRKCYIGVDVGTNAVRAVAIDHTGVALGSAVFPLVIHTPCPEFYEQSSEQIWTACCRAVSKVVEDCQLKVVEVRSIGFDATCSLVVLDNSGNPLPVSNPNFETPSKHHQSKEESDEEIWNVIMWMDHRAKKQADFINSTGHPCLKSVGQKISLEMQPPKLLWLKQNMPETYNKAGHFMDLADFLSYKATGSIFRSRCCVACKWMYSTDDAGPGHWDPSFYETIGMPKLVENNFWKIGAKVSKPGTACDSGLTVEASRQLGILPKTTVAVGMIDAHAGCLGILFAKINEKQENFLQNLPVTKKFAMICGTSTCHMAFSERPITVNGIWGPYEGVVIPNLWLNEAGQNSVGPILSMVAENYGKLLMSADNQSGYGDKQAKYQIHDFNNILLAKLNDYTNKHGYMNTILLAKNFNIWPDYHGNRSPLADSSISGAILGLRLESNVNKLEYCLGIYLAHVQSLALMTRFIMETLNEQGHQNFEAVYLCGGLQRNQYYVQAHANALQLPIIVVDDARDEPVARGAAILGATASSDFPDLETTAKILSPSGRIVKPHPEAKNYYDTKYVIFRKLGDLILDIKHHSFE